MAFPNWKTTVIYLFIVILVNIWVHVADGLLVVKPRDTQVLAGHVATLNCSTSLTEDVHWHHGTRYVYAGRKLYPPYNNRLKIEIYQKDGATEFNLVFSSANPEDAGPYVCRDNQGSGETSSAEMTVFTADENGTCRSNIKPDGVVIPNDCNIDPDEMQLSCGVTFYGNIPPQLEWKKVSDSGNSIAKTECQTINNRIFCNASITGDRQMNHSSYACQTTGSSELNVKLCTIEVKYLIYALNGHTPKTSSVGNEVQCNPDTSQLCYYKWKYYGIVVSTMRTITPDKIGLYQCEAECNIRGKRCIVYDYAYISDDDSKDSASSSTGYVVGICVLSLLLVIAISTAIYFVLNSKRKDRHLQLLQSTTSSRNDNDLKLTSQDNGTRHEQVPLMQKIVVDESELTRTLIPKASSEGKKAVFGLAILGEELFVVSHNWHTIEIFGDLEKLESRREFLLKGHQLEIPWDMQSCSKYKCLYIVDKKRNEEQNAEIVRIDSEGNVQKRWSTDCLVCRLSVTSESDVIVTSIDDRKIRHYTHDGELIREIELPIEIVSPWVALKRDKDKYIISYGNWSDSQHGVCAIDKNGNIQDHFWETKGQSNDQLNVPIHMTAFSDGHLLVADELNKRVVLLSKELECLRTIFTQVSKRYPNRLCLDEKNKRMFLSDNQWISDMKPWNNGRVLVFDISSIHTTFNINEGKKWCGASYSVSHHDLLLI